MWFLRLLLQVSQKDLVKFQTQLQEVYKNKMTSLKKGNDELAQAQADAQKKKRKRKE